MAYPSSFTNTTDFQALGGLPIPVYASPTSLNADVGVFLVGQAVMMINPPMLLQAVATAPASYVAKSTSLSTVSGGGGTVYWIPFQDGSQFAGQSAPFTARAVADQMPAYAAAGSGTGILTASATGAFGAIDGVTLALGDQILIPMGITNVRAAKDSGPWVVTTLGATGVKYVLTRPWWFYTGNSVTQGAQIRVGGAGNVFANTTWVVTAVQGTVIDTTDPAIYCREITIQVKLGGTATGNQVLSAGQPTAIANYPLTGGTASASTCPVGLMALPGAGAAPGQGPQVLCSLATRNGTLTGTVGYGILAAPTIGYVGTSSISINSIIATMIVNTAADTSTINVTIKNPC
jgi:hypothetical protein